MTGLIRFIQSLGKTMQGVGNYPSLWFIPFAQNSGLYAHHKNNNYDNPKHVVCLLVGWLLELYCQATYKVIPGRVPEARWKRTLTSDKNITS